MRVLIFATLALAFAPACGDDGNTKKDGGTVPIDAAPTADADCFTHPTTNDEIINACTTSQKIVKHPNLPLVGSDGSLPPLP
ncbi:MAG: hypothetical protein ABI678_21845 [Kofleriaceae bacterium]